MAFTAPIPILKVNHILPGVPELYNPDLIFSNKIGNTIIMQWKSTVGFMFIVHSVLISRITFGLLKELLYRYTY